MILSNLIKGVYNFTVQREWIFQVNLSWSYKVLSITLDYP